MKTTLCAVMSVVMIALSATVYSRDAAATVGVQTPGGQIEYNFFTRFSEQEAKEVAEILALATLLGRKTVFLDLTKLLDPKIGDKGFTADYFEKKLRALIAKKKPELTPVQKKMLDRFMVAARMVIDMNQERINKQGVGFKYFLPASWARETIGIFRAQTGIPIKQSGPVYRSPMGKPDAFEKDVLMKFTRADYDKKPYGAVGSIGKQKVYRHVMPIFIKTDFCLKCHGGPKGTKDVLGYEKEGLKVGDLRGIVSVAVPIR